MKLKSQNPKDQKSSSPDLKTIEKKGKVKVGNEFYSWEYDSTKHILQAWDSKGKTVCKEKMKIEDFEQFPVAPIIKRSLDK